MVLYIVQRSLGQQFVTPSPKTLLKLANVVFLNPMSHLRMVSVVANLVRTPGMTGCKKSVFGSEVCEDLN